MICRNCAEHANWDAVEAGESSRVWRCGQIEDDEAGVSARASAQQRAGNLRAAGVHERDEVVRLGPLFLFRDQWKDTDERGPCLSNLPMSSKLNGSIGGA